MLFYGFKQSDIEWAIDEANARTYRGNLVLHRETREWDTTKGPRVRGRIVVKDSHTFGARTSSTGRHMCAASWEAFRDVFQILFALNPQGRIATAMADYRGKEGFEAKYPATGCVNIGSQACPVTMPELSI